MSETNIFALNERKLERLNSGLADAISDRSFNLVLCATLLWGFIVDAAMVAYCSDAVVQLVASMNKWVALLAYVVPCLLGIFLAAKSSNPIVSFLGFNLLAIPMGAILCLAIFFTPAAIVTKALILTGIVTATMIFLGLIRPQIFLGLGRTLIIALVVGIVAELVATYLLHYSGSAFDWLFVIIFSGYIGYDIARSQVYPKTVDNAIDCALDIYLDIINLFIRLLSILSRRD